MADESVIFTGSGDHCHEFRPGYFGQGTPVASTAPAFTNVPVRNCVAHVAVGHLRSPSRSLRDKVDDRQQAHPVLLSTTLCQRKPPVVLRRPEAASHHSLATVAPSGGAGENGAAMPVTAT